MSVENMPKKKSSGKKGGFLRLLRGRGKPPGPTPHEILLKRHGKEVKILNTWRSELGIAPNSNLDRAAAMVVDGWMKRGASGTKVLKNTFKILRQKQNETGGPDMVRHRIFMMSETAYINALKSQLKNAKGSEAEALESKIRERQGFLDSINNEFNEYKKTEGVYYGDEEVPEWHKASHPAQPAFQKFIKVRE